MQRAKDLIRRICIRAYSYLLDVRCWSVVHDYEYDLSNDSPVKCKRCGNISMDLSLRKWEFLELKEKIENLDTDI